MFKKLAFACYFFAFSAHAATISLNDGSQIIGDIQGLAKGIYTINTSNLGTLQVPQEKIITINYNENKANTANIDSKKAENAIGAIQQKINNNPQLLNGVKALQQDGDVQAILGDKHLLESVKSGDIGALITDPKIQNLMNNPKVKALGEQLQQLK